MENSRFQSPDHRDPLIESAIRMNRNNAELLGIIGRIIDAQRNNTALTLRENTASIRYRDNTGEKTIGELLKKLNVGNTSVV